MSDLQNGAAYIRVSTHDQEELSPDAQKRLILDYAKQHHIFIAPDDIYIESGISGRKADKRPQFQRMIATAKQKSHPYDIILVWKFSRFARNQEESIVYKSMLKKDHVDVVSISEPLIDGPFGSLIERIIEWMDEYYSIRLSGEVFRGMSENAIRGKYQARPPLGYKIPYPHAAPVIVEEEAAIVRLIFRLYTKEQKSAFEISRYLNAHGFLTSRGKPFERRSVTYILQNESYTGKTVWNRTHNLTNTAKPKEEWIIADGTHPAIITPEQFNAARNRFESEYTPRNSRPVSTCRHWLSGIVKCSNCGRSLTTSVHQDKRYHRQYVNFQCYGYMKGKCNVSHQISEKKLAPKVLDSLQHVLDSGTLDYHVVYSQQSEAPDQILRNRIHDLDKKMTRIKEAYRNGIDTLEEYRENKELLSQERTQLEQQLQNVTLQTTQQGLPDTQQMLQALSDVYQTLLNDNVSIPEKNQALRRVVEKIIFDKEQSSVQIYYQFIKPLF